MEKKDIGTTPDYCPYCGNDEGISGDMVDCDFEVTVDYFCQKCERNYNAVFIFERVEKAER